MPFRLTKNKLVSILYVFSKVYEKIIGLTIIGFIIHGLGKVVLGKYLFAFAIAHIALNPPQSHFSTILIRDVSLDPSKTSKYFSSITIIRGLYSLLVISLIILAMFFFHNSMLYLVLLSAIFLISENFCSTVISIFMAYKKFSYIIFLSFATKTFLLILILLFTFLRSWDLYSILSIQIAVSLVNLAASIFLYKKVIGPISFTPDFSIVLNIIRKYKPFLLLIAYGILLHRMDTVMLGIFTDYGKVGTYGIASNLVQAIVFVPLTLLHFTYPFMTSMQKDKASLFNLYKKFTRSIVISFSLIALFLILLTVFFNDIINKLFGSYGISDAIPMFSILCISLPLFLSNRVTTRLLYTIRYERRLAWILGVTVLLKFLINLFFMPRYGYYAPIFGAIIINVFQFSVLAFLTHDYFKDISPPAISA